MINEEKIRLKKEEERKTRRKGSERKWKDKKG